MQMNEVMKELRSAAFTENVIVDLSPLQTGTAAWAVQGGGSLQVNMLLLRIATSFMLRKSDLFCCEHSSRGETSLSSASALDMRLLSVNPRSRGTRGGGLCVLRVLERSRSSHSRRHRSRHRSHCSRIRLCIRYSRGDRPGRDGRGGECVCDGVGGWR